MTGGCDGISFLLNRWSKIMNINGEQLCAINSEITLTQDSLHWFELPVEAVEYIHKRLILEHMPRDKDDRVL